MAEDKKTTQPVAAKAPETPAAKAPEPAKVPDWNTAKAKLAEARKYFEGFIGKEGHNPFHILGTIEKLEQEIANPDNRNASTYDQVIALKLDPPTV